jgi:endonuclease/exonuclease/phosphatase (EEP) superfamily protein YafD
MLNINGAEAQTIGLSQLIFNAPKDQNVLDRVGRSHTPHLSPKSIKVLVWNAHKGEDPQWDDDLSQLGGDRDLILIQEAVFNPFMIEAFQNMAGRLWTTATSFRMLHQKNVGTGLATASVAQPMTESFLRTLFTEPVSGTTKLTLFTTYAIKDSNQTLMVVNIHAINFVTPWKFKIEMNRLHDRLKKHQGPILMAGDFNTWSDGRSEKLNKITKELGMNAITFPDGARNTSLKLILDHAFVRGLSVKKVDNLGHITTSDHSPLSFELSIN